MFSRLRYVLPLVIASLTIPSLALPAAAQATEPGSKIAVVNTAKVFNDMQETRDLKQKLEIERKRLEAENQTRRATLNSLKEARDQLKPESAQYQEKNKAMLEEAVKYDAWQKLTQLDVQRNQKLQMKLLFGKIEAAVAEVAQQKGLDLVLTDQRPEIPEDLENLNAEQLRALINARTVLFAGPKADLTADVLAALNAKYAANKPEAAATPQP